MTTWDLLRLLRNMERLNWPREAVQAVLYRNGRIEPRPEHYLEIGAIVKTWKPAFGIVPKQPVEVGTGWRLKSMIRSPSSKSLH